MDKHIPRSKKTEKNRIRCFKPKSKKGCRTCKIRRVKCGEEKPSCKRCTSTGRKCDGYGYAEKSQSPAEARYSSLTSYIPSADIPGDENERHGFYHFRTRTVSAIGGVFSSEFWEYSVLQTCYVEPTVRHALLALSALHEIRNIDGHHEFSNLEAQQNGFALRQYTKAIGLLASEIAAKNERSLQVTLMSCLIFVYLELYRDDAERAMQHLKSGLQILQNWQKSKRVQTADPRRLKWASQDIDPSLVIMYRRMNVSATVHGCQDGGFDSSYTTEEARNAMCSQETFSNLAMAAREMDIQLVALFHNLRRQYEEEFVTFKSFPGVNEPLLHRLQLWHRSYQRFLRESKESNKTGALLLQIHYLTISVNLKSAERDSEMWFDDQNHIFREILDLAETIISQDPRFNGGYANLSIGLGVIGPLFYTGIRCRKLDYRRKAVDLMELSPFREGLWHSKHLLNYVKWKIAKEEAFRGDVPECEALPLHARMGKGNYVEVKAEDGELSVFLEFEHGPRDANGRRRMSRELMRTEWNYFKGMI